MVKKIFVIIILLIIFIIAAFAITLINNRANLLQTPGPGQRLSVFLNENTAFTADNHPFPELITPFYRTDSDRVYNRVIQAGKVLGWHIKTADPENQKIEFEVSTPVFGYIDDVVVQVKFVNLDQSQLYIRSRSRVGKGDLAANSGHIQTLLEQLNAGVR